jgi:hypothetical protein
MCTSRTAAHPRRCQREPRLWLDNEQGLFPGPNSSCEQYQEQPISFGTGGSFDLSAEDNQRLSKERVFCHQFGLASGKVCQHPHHERGGGFRFGPVSEALMKQLKAKACHLYNEEKNPMHSGTLPLLKMCRYMHFDCTLP